MASGARPDAAHSSSSVSAGTYGEIRATAGRTRWSSVARGSTLMRRAPSVAACRGAVAAREARASQRLAAGEPGVDLVPPGDGRLAQPPAQVHYAAAAPGGEVDQPRLDVFQLYPQRQDLLDAAVQRGQLGLDRSLAFEELLAAAGVAVDAHARAVALLLL